ncbi:unnamed protein product [Camellia sinensis]
MSLNQEVASKQEVYAGVSKRALPENGILISGCQTDQTSADASPSGNADEAYGALSNAIQMIIAETDGTRKVGYTEQRWKEKPNSSQMSPGRESVSKAAADVVTNRLGAMSIAGNSGQIRVGLGNHVTVEGRRAVWKPKSYGTVSGDTMVEVEKTPADQTAAAEKNSAVLSKLFKGNLLETFTVDNSTYSLAQIRATFYPKFENEKSDQEVRTRMIEMVSKGLATLEVSLKHSGSLFMYAGHEGGAYAKNSYGNIYTAVGVFVLGRMFREGWGTEASKKQAEFNDFLESNRMCISMELVTAVLGDHGQRPRDDYVVVTAVTELGNGKPKFYSTPDIIAFCRKWRLPTNHVWLFSTRKSVTSFFASYDALCEEGTATTVCKALDEVADISVPGSKDHIKVQGEILEGLVARMVSHESSKHMEQVSRDFPPQSVEGVDLDLGLSLREICAVNRSDEKQQIKALLESQEMIRLMRERRFPAAFKCYHNFHKIGSVYSDNLFFKMVIHVHSDSAFRRYQKEMRNKPGLWPLYRGFFVDINLFKENREKAAQTAKNTNDLLKNVNSSNGTLAKDDLADEDANLMIKLKFLTYKLRTFLIRNGLSILFKQGPSAYKTYYLRQMKIWNTSPGKQKQLSKMLDEWAVYIRRKCGNKQLSSSTYLSEAEPFLEQYAKRSPENQALIGSAGSLVRAEDFMAIVEGGRDEEGDLETEREVAPSSPSASDKDTVAKNEGLIVFFPGIPGCAKSALCKEILNAPGGLGDDRPVHSLMGDLIKGKYWDKVDEQWKRKPNSIMLADKNAPNEEVWLRKLCQGNKYFPASLALGILNFLGGWMDVGNPYCGGLVLGNISSRLIEEMCRRMRASAVPVVSDSEGTETNPFSLDALAVFIYRVLHRVNHPGNLDKNSQNAGYVLLMFYNLYDGKSRKEFEGELIERFGSLVKMPLLKPDRDPLPDSVKSILEEGLNLYQLHQRRHGRAEPTKGSYAKDWAKWEKQLREVLFSNADYLNSIQVPFEFAVEKVLEQLRTIGKGDYSTPSTEKRKFGNIVYAAVSLPVGEIQSLLDNLAEKNPKVEALLQDKNLEGSLKKAHVTLAHKRSHGVTAVANYGVFLDQNVPVNITALLFSDKMAALEASLGSVDGEKISSKNQWPHVTLWTGEGVAAKEANSLPQLHSVGTAIRIDIDPPITITGVLQFY